MSFDRRAASAVGAAAALSVLLSVALTDSPALEPAPIRHDPEALAALVALLDASDQADWLVEYEFHRALHEGESISYATAEAQRGTARVVQGPTSVRTEVGATAFNCTIAGAELACIEEEVTEALSASEVVHGLVVRSGYAVATLAGERIAGEAARCFRVIATTNFHTSFGLERQFCFADDGVPLRRRVLDVNAADEWIATSVERQPTEADLEALVSDLEAAAREGDD